MILLLVVPLNGCLEFVDKHFYSDSITYQAYPTSIQFTISYGYQVNTTGAGLSTVRCILDLPEILNGSISHLATAPAYEDHEKIADNLIIEWNESTTGSYSRIFDVTAQINSNNFPIDDLTGASALTIEDIRAFYPDIINQYCTTQGDDDIRYIDPFHPEIRSIAGSIKNNSESTNSFLIAKQIFEWLKSNTEYEVHVLLETTQPAPITLIKGQGDCDDLSYLYISLCRSLKIPARFIRGYLVNLDDTTVTAIDHMWVEVFVGGDMGIDGWIPVECAGTGKPPSEVHQNFGMESAFHLRLFTDDGTNESINISTSHISVQYEYGMSIDISPYAKITDFRIEKSQELTIKQNLKRVYS
jgi:transglutaminase-like putative cysteine protease